MLYNLEVFQNYQTTPLLCYIRYSLVCTRIYIWLRPFSRQSSFFIFKSLSYSQYSNNQQTTRSMRVEVSCFYDQNSGLIGSIILHSVVICFSSHILEEKKTPASALSNSTIWAEFWMMKKQLTKKFFKNSRKLNFVRNSAYLHCESNFYGSWLRVIEFLKKQEFWWKCYGLKAVEILRW